ncbi:hypothetical protein BZA05DRAFT_132431 [Tricharina praecox]|uniref:uncharacterized protein n=1 Tax=Tricharina praecox TaxID=43433 RepID=UPI00221FD9B7|nr:uncharacterized protein BZA05DRAFT_132431 [Tricharina praecox]KAI5846647.1 hypothetical protein BZA05DRAFT_132431 [Tricharina praecox]
MYLMKWGWTCVCGVASGILCTSLFATYHTSGSDESCPGLARGFPSLKRTISNSLTHALRAGTGTVAEHIVLSTSKRMPICEPGPGQVYLHKTDGIAVVVWD